MLKYHYSFSHLKTKGATMKKIALLTIIFCFYLGIAAQNSIIDTTRSGDHTTLSKILKAGKSPDIPNRFNKTALMYACYDGDFESVKILIENGADINRQDNEGWTALFYAVSKNREDIAQYLIAKGANKQIKDISGKRPYDYAVADGNTQIADMVR